MRYRQLGNSDMELSVIGLGTWPISGSGWVGSWGPQDDRQSVATILAAYESGINWADTAPDYGIGHSEEVVGRALKELDGEMYVATKVGLHWDENRERFHSLRRETVVRELENSLRRLDRETVDLYQIHWPVQGDDEQSLEGWEAISRLIEQGKVRYGGVSNFDVELLRAAQRIHPVTSVQPPYNMLRREIEADLLPYCGSRGVGVVCYGTLLKGIMTGKYDHESVQNLAEDDHRRRSRYFQEPLFSAILDLVDFLTPIAERSGRSLSQLALAWVLRKQEVTAAIVGAKSPEQIAETAAAGDRRLAPDDADRIDRYLAEHSEQLAGG